MDRRTFSKMMAAALIEAQVQIQRARALNSESHTTATEDSPRSGAEPGEPLRIGSQKQLFIDRWIVEDASEVLFTVMPPAKYPANPVFIADDPVDGQLIYPAGVQWNNEKKLFQMWYVAIHFETGKETHLLAYAESEDGVNWQRPQLGVQEFEGSSANNLVKGPPGMIIFDSYEADPNRRLKMLAGTSGFTDIDIWFSADGIHWTPSANNPALTHVGDTHSLLGWDEGKKQYVGYFRPAGLPRKVGISLSSDAERWTPIETILAPDEHDPVGTEFYWLHAGIFENIYVGLLSVLHLDARLLDTKQTDPIGQEQTVDIQLVSSSDGVHWNRMGNRLPWLPLGPYQSWDDQVIWPAVPFSFDGRIWIYYGGDSVRHTVGDLHNGAGKKADGRTRLGGIGLATLREDGWVAARPNLHRKGVLTTRQFIVEGARLYMNLNASEGKCTVELLTPDGNALPGFSGGEASEVSADSLSYEVKWKRSLAEIAGKPIRLRFTLERAELYAFQFRD